MLESDAGRHRLSNMLGRPIGETNWGFFERQLNAIEAHGVGVVTFLDVEYPRYFHDIAKPPPILFYKGDLTVLNRRGVAIVGARNASARGCAFAASLASDLAARRIVVVSGAARGIDGAAHSGALKRSGSTVAVVGTGLDVHYPAENASLIHAVSKVGCVLGEQLMGTQAVRYVFPLRNRLISALSRVVVVVEAGERSGALVTAKWALEQGRDVGAVPGFPGDPRSRGVNRLLKDGAHPIESVEDIIKAVPLVLEGISESADATGGPHGSTVAEGLFPAAGAMSEEARMVFGALGKTPTDPDTLAEHVRRDVPLVQRVLLDLEMRGMVARDAGGAYYRL
jgi:DNA processing protein